MREIDNTPSEDAAANSSFGRLGIDQLDPPQEEDEDTEAKEEVAVLREAVDLGDWGAAAQTVAVLREAVDLGDWGTVAQPASGLSGRLVDDTTSMASSRTLASDGTTCVSDRSQEINALVDTGDWEVVVAAASRYNTEVDRSFDPHTKSTEERRARRQRRLDEEVEALAHADIWSAIDEQSMGEITNACTSQPNEFTGLFLVDCGFSDLHFLSQLFTIADAGAKDAADWAIARSLSALNLATEEGKLKSTGSERLETQTESEEDE
jgi:hypothetical protein